MANIRVRKHLQKSCVLRYSCMNVGHAIRVLVHRPLSKIPYYSLFVPPKFCISIVFILSWDLQWSQERLETILTQNFGGTNKKYYGIFESGLLHCN